MLIAKKWLYSGLYPLMDQLFFKKLIFFYKKTTIHRYSSPHRLNSGLDNSMLN